MDNQQWETVGAALKSGRYNLLLGAGVSLDSGSGIPNQNCPSVKDLTAALQTALPKVRAGSSLNRLYRTMTPEQVEKLITNRFSGCIPGETVKAIAAFRWKRIFTLNVDDALERAYNERPAPLQKYKVFNYTKPYESVRDLRILPIIHLHGWSNEPEDGYIFDIKEYMGSIKDNNIWSNVLGSLIRTEPFIVLGSSLEEPDISYFLSDRTSAPNRPDRPPSVLVEPYPDAGTETDCDEYKMSLFEGTASNFLREINNRFPVRPTVEDAIQENLGDLAALPVEPAALAEFHSDFERVPDKPLLGSDGGPNFAYGHQPTWLDLQNERDVARTETSAWQLRISKAESCSVLIIEGEAGAGKSTTLKRLAWNTAQINIPCFWLRAIGRIRTRSSAKVLSSIKKKCIIFVDNFADNVVEVAELRQQLKSENIVFVGAERSYRTGHVKRVMADTLPALVQIGAIGSRLSEHLIRSYTNYGLAASPGTDTNPYPLENELIAIACCRILHNFEPLSTIIDRSMRDGSAGVESYIFSALAAHCCRRGVEYDVISSEFPDYQIDVQADGNGPLPLKMDTFSDVEFVTPLNDAVADTVLRRFAGQNPDRILNTFVRLAHSIRPRVSVRAIIDGAPCARIASRLFDYDEVVKPILGVAGAEDFYTATKAEWEWNSRYWHQIAQLRLDMASLTEDSSQKRLLAELAVQHARFAKGIEQRHQFTMTTIGRILFGKMRVLHTVTAPDLGEAIDALNQAIRIEKEKQRTTVHPFMILFKGLLEAIDLGATLSYDQKTLIGYHITRVSELFSSDNDIISEAQKLRRVI